MVEKSFQEEIQKIPVIDPERGSVTDLDVDINIFRKRLDFSETPQFAGGNSRRRGFKLALWTVASASVDLSITLGMTALFLLVGTMILQTTRGLIRYSEFMTLGSILFLTISISYFLLLRLFLGATYGEYSCSLRLGKPAERVKKSYILKVFFRICLISLSGFIMLPLLSILFKKDLAGKISGLSIYSLK